MSPLCFYRNFHHQQNVSWPSRVWKSGLYYQLAKNYLTLKYTFWNCLILSQPHLTKRCFPAICKLNLTRVVSTYKSSSKTDVIKCRNMYRYSRRFPRSTRRSCKVGLQNLWLTISPKLSLKQVTFKPWSSSLHHLHRCLLNIDKPAKSIFYTDDAYIIKV